MIKRIFKSISVICALAVIFSVALIAVMLFGTYEDQMADEIRAQAELLQFALAKEEDEIGFFDGFSLENRVSLIAPDGTVLYDSDVHAADMDDHSNRPEVASALETGRGESQRYSQTFSETTTYYALRTKDGNVLRIANTRSSVLGVFVKLLTPLAGILVLTLVIAFFIARKAARRIVAPLNSLDLDHPLENQFYDELSPLLTRMDHQRREIEAQLQSLREAQNELSTITGNMREGLVIIDEHGAILSMNESAAKIFGVEALSKLGENILTVSRSAVLRDAVHAAQGGTGADCILEKDGAYYRLMASPVYHDGRTEGVVLLILDVTERHMAEINRREFTSNVSHELKTPLTSISGYAQIMRDGVARAEDIRNFASKICAEANRLMALINDILELSRLDERKGLGEKENISLSELARETAGLLEKQAQDKNIKISVDAQDVNINGYKLILSEMLTNLVDNAVKYTPDGGSVTISVYPEKGSAVFRVKDTGIGIAREHQNRVFERFYRVDKSHSRATGGTGLGLSIVKHGAQIHDATITLESEIGKGTSIELRFPIAL